MIHEHVMMEIERRLADTIQYDQNFTRFARLAGLGGVDLAIPDDDLDVAAGLELSDASDQIWRGSFRFPLITAGLGQTCRRLARIVYAISLGDDEDLQTGEPIRSLDSAVSVIEVLLLDPYAGKFTWVQIDDRLVPLATIRALDQRMIEDAVLQEQAAKDQLSGIVP